MDYFFPSRCKQKMWCNINVISYGWQRVLNLMSGSVRLGYHTPISPSKFQRLNISIVPGLYSLQVDFLFRQFHATIFLIYSSTNAISGKIFFFLLQFAQFYVRFNCGLISSQRFVELWIYFRAIFPSSFTKKIFLLADSLWRWFASLSDIIISQWNS